MAFSGPLEDRLAIRELIETYADAVFRVDAEAWSATWAEDGVWNLMGHEVRGRDAIVTAWKQAMSQFAVAAFYAQPGALEIDGARATGRCYTSEVLKAHDGTIRRINGVYEDTFVKTGGRWAFAARAYGILIDQSST